MRIDLEDATVQTCLLLLSFVPEAVIETMLAPLVPFMISLLSTDLPPSEIGGRAGLLTGIFYLPLLVMGIVWGAVSDSNIGRKPILLLGLFFSAVSIAVLGANKSSFGVALMCRFLAGVFGANSNIAKSAFGEIHSNPSDRAWAYSAYGSVYGASSDIHCVRLIVILPALAFSGIVGPFIGAILAQAGSGSAYPYLNVGIFGSTLSLASWLVVFLFLRDSKHTEKVEQTAGTSSMKVEDSADESRDQNAAQSTSSPSLLSVLKSRQLVISIVLYATISFCNMAYNMLFSLAFATPVEMGGFGFSASETSFLMTVPAFSKLFSQTFLCRKLVLLLGQEWSYALGMAFILPATFGIGLFAGVSHGQTWTPVVACLIMVGFVEAMSYLCVMIMISNSVSSKSLGMAFGVASVFAAAAKTVAPPVSGWAWEYATTRANNSLLAFAGVQAAAFAAICLSAFTRATTAKVKKD
ncbi:hypothetical protein HDU84_001759 [Entophlyctis sp. JEL0112]|nr:hypothetical protein HDU84_001759 [Entophlyctis sp. JEL0112]